MIERDHGRLRAIHHYIVIRRATYSQNPFRYREAGPGLRARNEVTASFTQRELTMPCWRHRPLILCAPRDGIRECLISGYPNAFDLATVCLTGNTVRHCLLYGAAAHPTHRAKYHEWTSIHPVYSYLNARNCAIKRYFLQHC